MVPVSVRVPVPDFVMPNAPLITPDTVKVLVLPWLQVRVALNVRGTTIVCPAAPEATVRVVPVPVNVMAFPLTVNAEVVVESKVRQLILSGLIFWFVGRFAPAPVKITLAPAPGAVP